MNDLSDAVERLTRGMEALEQRVCALEASGRGAPAVAVQPVLAAQPLTAPEPQSAAGGSGIFAILGKAMLGIAGAYLLRAAVQSGTLPRWPVIAVSIAYALVWLIPATRVPAKAWFASAAWAGTSSLILIPMLWELTVRFRFLPSAATAAILGVFVLAASALAWKRHFAAIAGVADAAASLAALVLAVASRDLPPFLFALLAMAIMSELAAARYRRLRVRPVVAAAADLAVFALIWIYSGPAGSHMEYPAIAAPLPLVFAPALLCVYGASATAQTLLLRRGISVFEIAQTLLAALLTVWTIVVFQPGHGPLLLGGLCLMASAAGYVVAFACFDRLHAQRNYHVYATGSLALLLTGSVLSLPPGWLPFCLGCAAVITILLGTYASRRTLQFHALALLAAAALSSGLLVFVFRAMAGALPPSPRWIVSFTAACAISSYAVVTHRGEEALLAHELRLLFAVLAVSSAAALLVWTSVHLTVPGAAPAAEYLAVVRTLVSCAAALALSWCGFRWQRRDLVWLAWTTLALIALKLVFEDLRHGHLEFTAASIFSYAITILLVPQLLHSRKQSRHARN